MTRSDINGILKKGDASFRSFGYVRPGARLKLRLDRNVTLLPNVFQAFWGEVGHVLVFEVQTVNDDQTEEKFEDSIGSFPAVDEDQVAKRLLGSGCAARICRPQVRRNELGRQS